MIGGAGTYRLGGSFFSRQEVEIVRALVRGEDPERFRPVVQALCEAHPLP